jgi:hypothetical protein
LISDLGPYEGIANLCEIGFNKEINPMKCAILSMKGKK